MSYGRVFLLLSSCVYMQLTDNEQINLFSRYIGICIARCADWSWLLPSHGRETKSLSSQGHISGLCLILQLRLHGIRFTSHSCCCRFWSKTYGSQHWTVLISSMSYCTNCQIPCQLKDQFKNSKSIWGCCSFSILISSFMSLKEQRNKYWCIGLIFWLKGFWSLFYLHNCALFTQSRKLLSQVKHLYLTNWQIWTSSGVSTIWWIGSLYKFVCKGHVVKHSNMKLL